MTLTQLGGAILICILCPLLGALPLISIIFSLRHRQDLRQLGTGNASVSAAFYHGGKFTGILAVISEAGKGILAVLLARMFFPIASPWELIALIALVFGRYVGSKGAGTTNVMWGSIVHDPVVAGIGLLVAGVGFTVTRDRTLSKYSVLVILPLLLALFHPQQTARLGAAIALSSLLGWIYTKIPDDLNLPAHQVRGKSQPMFNFFRGERGITYLNAGQLEAAKVGNKAANLSQLHQGGYPVPEGWVFLPGDDLDVLIQYLQPSSDDPLVVRSSARGEDTETSTAAGQYVSILNVGSKLQLQQALLDCLAGYNQPRAVRYRADNQIPEAGMAVLIQRQISGMFSGVAFSRDPLAGEGVAIEALPGNATRVVSGKVTPEQYQVLVSNLDLEASSDWRLPEDLELSITSTQGAGDVPIRLIQQVAYLVRKIEADYHGIPQDVEWTYDGQNLWVLQSRPITTLLPIWTRKIAAEVIPGAIHPLTWSINRPLTCGVWGEIFTIVLGDKATDLDFTETATLHNAHAYFNATLLGQIFLRMGLPPESLEFLTRGAKFSKPPLLSTLQNIPGLLRLLQRELSLEKDFNQDYRLYFAPILDRLGSRVVGDIPEEPRVILEGITEILTILKKATYYSIFTPLSFAIRQGIYKIPEGALDNSSTPEIAAGRSLSIIADRARDQLPPEIISSTPEKLFAYLEQNPISQKILQEFNQWLQTYGYLSEVGTDIAVPTWQEDSQYLQKMFQQFLQVPNNQPSEQLATNQPDQISSNLSRKTNKSYSWQHQKVQQRLHLKGKVTSIYSQLLAQLRYKFIHLEQHWLTSGLLTEAGDIFYLEFGEIQELITQPNSNLLPNLNQLINQRKSQFQANKTLTNIPLLVFGNTPLLDNSPVTIAGKYLQGIAASSGQKIGTIKIVRRLQDAQDINKDTILVVPYTDSGWSIALSQAGGIIAEVGGRLSHGAIIAREYRIPAVMDVHKAMQLLRSGQKVRLDGDRGIVEILPSNQDQ